MCIHRFPDAYTVQDEDPWIGLRPDSTRSLLYKLVMNGMGDGVKVDKTLFREVHTTKYGYMRIYEVQNVSKKSKTWAMDPANRKCDAPGSWCARSFS